MQSQEGKQPSSVYDYLKLAISLGVVVVAFAGWFVQWQVSVQSTFSMHEAQIEALSQKITQERTLNMEGRREILQELRTIRSEIRAVFLQGVQDELKREKGGADW